MEPDLIRIRTITEAFFGTVLSRRCKERTRYVTPRMFMCYYARERYGLKYTLGAIAKQAGLTSHGTVIHHVNKMQGYVEYDRHIRKEYAAYKKHVDGLLDG